MYNCHAFLQHLLLLINIFSESIQIQLLQCYKLEPEEWDWKLIKNTLEQIQTLLPPGPEKLINM